MSGDLPAFAKLDDLTRPVKIAEGKPEGAFLLSGIQAGLFASARHRRQFLAIITHRPLAFPVQDGRLEPGNFSRGLQIYLRDFRFRPF